VNCGEVRRALDAEPGRRTPELEAHVAACPGCARYAAEAARLEATLRRALEVPVPPPPAGRKAPALRTAPWLALAASLAGLALATAAIVALYPREALAAALVGHMAHEPESRVPTAAVVPEASLRYVLRRAGVALGPDAPPVSYARSCWFRGAFVPHLVVQTEGGPMTVMVLSHEHVVAPARVDEGAYRVVIVPAARGALAVLAERPADPSRVDAVVARLAASLRAAD
jgi:hypothetical protein